MLDTINRELKAVRLYLRQEISTKMFVRSRTNNTLNLTASLFKHTGHHNVNVRQDQSTKDNTSQR